MVRVMTKFLLLLAMAFLLTASAQANTIGTLTLTNCGSAGSGCPGATYSFNIGTTSATLTITINGPVNSTNNIIQSVNLGFTQSSNISGLTLSANPAGIWTSTTGSLNNNGCGTNNGAFVCATSSPGVTIVQGNTYIWTWTYNALSPSTIFSVGNVHIGADYDPHNGRIVSQTGAQVPEPASLLLFGTGLISIAGVVRRRILS